MVAKDGAQEIFLYLCYLSMQPRSEPTIFHVLWSGKKFVTRISDNIVAEISREDMRLGDLAAIVLEYSSQQETPTHSLFHLLNSYLKRRRQRS
jgi:hypothetical protein